MEIGMLWFDNSKKPQSELIAIAAAYYKKKYEIVPNLVFVNAEQLEEEYITKGIVIKGDKRILKHHYWIGRE